MMGMIVVTARVSNAPRKTSALDPIVVQRYFAEKSPTGEVTRPLLHERRAES